MQIQGATAMKRGPEKNARKAHLPNKTRRKDGFVLATKGKAEAVERSERRRAKMYALMEQHPESAEELLVKASTVRASLTHKPKDKPVASAQGKLVKSYVSSPTVLGARDHVESVIDTIEWMRSRRQLDSRQHQAAQRLRSSWDTINGSVGGVMDYDRVRGAGSPGAPPASAYMVGAEYLRQCKNKLYARDHLIALLVACLGYRIDDAAAVVFRATRPSRAQKDEIGRCLRAGLTELAQLWFPVREEDEADAMVAYHAPDADPKLVAFSSKAGRRDLPFDHAHASGRKVFRK